MNDSLVALGLLHLAALASPGPDYLLVSQYALLNGRYLGAFASLGIALGVLTHAILCLTGLTVVFTQWPQSLWIIRCLGALYLVSLGGRALWQILALSNNDTSTVQKNVQQSEETLTKQSVTDKDQAQTRAAWQAFIRGFMTNLLNPKAIIFFASLFTAFIPEEGRAQFGLFASVSLFSLTLLWFMLVALVLSHPRVQARAQNHYTKLEAFTGVAFILMGLGVIVLPFVPALHA